MKPISELGLETIQLEDQVLLVDPNEASQEGDWIYWNKRPVKAIDTTYSKDTKYIIASTKPLEGLPLLVIEDEADEIIDQEMIKMGHEPSRVRHPIFGEDRELAKALYYKAKETFKFTEEDLRNALEMARVTKKYKYGEGRVFSNSIETIYQSLTKKELWVEAHWNCCGRCIDGEDKCTGKWELKIEKNQIKAVWK